MICGQCRHCHRPPTRVTVIEKYTTSPFLPPPSVATTQVAFFAIFGNKLCKITRIFQGVDPSKADGSSANSKRSDSGSWDIWSALLQLTQSVNKADQISQEQWLRSLKVGRGPIGF